MQPAHRSGRSPGRALMTIRLSTLCVTVLGVVAASAPAQYDSRDVELYANLDTAFFGSGNGNDCWGFVSPSGREYALMGLRSAMAVVEITDPVNPVLIGQITHNTSTWGDIKVYKQYAYVVNESGGGIDIVDLGDVDAGNVTLVRRYTGGGVRSSHNVLIDEDSGYLYLAGSNLNGGAIVAFNLEPDPTNPVWAGQWNGNYAHDAQVVTYTTGQYAGRQIAFCSDGGRGFDIVDVTNKSSMIWLSNIRYPGLDYCHQGWISEDQAYFYLNDEGDELAGHTQTTRTIVIDITDLSAPSMAGSFTSGFPSTDHNLYVHEGFVFEANYTTGLQVFDVGSDPVSPPHVGYFDTYPANNNPGYNGAWSVYPFFPSGTVLISDQARGLFILDVSQAVGKRMALQISPLIAGQTVDLDIDGAKPNQRVHFAYSLSGKDWTSVPALGVYMQLTDPVRAGSAQADANGHARLTRLVPAQGAGLTIWIQAAHVGKTSNVVEASIQ